MAVEASSAIARETAAQRDKSTRDEICINTIRTLAMDAVQKAHSGHPGTPMGLAPVAYTLWQQFLERAAHWGRQRYDPAGPGDRELPAHARSADPHHRREPHWLRRSAQARHCSETLCWIAGG